MLNANAVLCMIYVCLYCTFLLLFSNCLINSTYRLTIATLRRSVYNRILQLHGPILLGFSWRLVIWTEHFNTIRYVFHIFMNFELNLLANNILHKSFYWVYPLISIRDYIYIYIERKKKITLQSLLSTSCSIIYKCCQKVWQEMSR